jgi:hypothetical protein
VICLKNIDCANNKHYNANKHHFAFGINIDDVPGGNNEKL